jgi:hypothetical protein
MIEAMPITRGRGERLIANTTSYRYNWQYRIDANAIFVKISLINSRSRESRPLRSCEIFPSPTCREIAGKRLIRRRIFMRGAAFLGRANANPGNCSRDQGIAWGICRAPRYGLDPWGFARRSQPNPARPSPQPGAWPSHRRRPALVVDLDHVEKRHFSNQTRFN